MGGGQSIDNTSTKKGSTTSPLRKNLQSIVRLMMPVYYSVDPISPEEYEAAHKCWSMIMANTAPGFLLLRKGSVEFGRKYTTSIMYFSECFYARLFDVHPMARSMFRDMKSQGTFLVKMISLSLSEMADVGKFERTLQKLAEVHNERGVKAVEYGIVGEVLIWAIKCCVGADFTPQAHVAWIKIYSRMLRIMVPSAVAFELEGGSKHQADRMLKTESTTFNYGSKNTTSIMQHES